MKKLATTKEQEDVLERIEYETISSVRDAWKEYFFVSRFQNDPNATVIKPKIED